MTSLFAAYRRWRDQSFKAQALTLCSLLGAPGLGFLCVVAALMGSSRPIFLLLLPIGLILGLLFLIRPDLLLISILVTRGGLDPLLEMTKVPLGSSSIGMGGVLNFFIILLTLIIVRERRPERMLPLISAAAPAILVLLISAARSPTPAEAIKLMLGIATYLCAFIIGVIYVGEHGIKKTLGVVLYASGIAVVISIVMLITGWHVSGGDGIGEMMGARGRFSGAFSHPNIMAFFLTNTAILCLYFFDKKLTMVPRLALYALFLASLGLIVLSQTRAAWAAVIVVLSLYSALFDRRGFILILLGGAIISTIPSVQERLINLVDNRSYLIYSTLDSYTWRKTLWQDALRTMTPGMWLYGNGLNSFFVDSVKFFSRSGGNPFGAHSVYVQLLYEAGIIGLGCAVFLLAAIAKFFISTKGTHKDVAFSGLCFIAAYCTVCYSDNILKYLVYNIYFWMSIGAFIGYCRSEWNKQSSRVCTVEGQELSSGIPQR